MALGYFAILAAVKHRLDLESGAHGSKHSPKQKKEVYESKPRHFDIKDLIDSEPTMSSCLLSYLEDNPDAKAAISKLLDETQKLFDAAHAGTHKSILDLVPDCEQVLSRYEASKSAIAAMGLDVQTRSGESDADMLWFVKPSDSIYSHGYGYITVPIPISINGAKLTREMVENGENPYVDTLREFNAKYPHLEEELLKTQEQVDELKSHSISLKLSKKKQEQLQRLEERLEHIQSVVSQKQLLEKHFETFASLSDSQRETLLEYLDSEQAMVELGKKVYDLRKKSILEIGHYRGDYEFCYDETYNKFIAGLVSEAVKTLSPEETKQIEDFLDQSMIAILAAPSDELEERGDFKKSSVVTNTPARTSALYGISGFVIAQLKEALEKAEKESTIVKI